MTTPLVTVLDAVVLALAFAWSEDSQSRYRILCYQWDSRTGLREVPGSPGNGQAGTAQRTESTRSRKY